MKDNIADYRKKLDGVARLTSELNVGEGKMVINVVNELVSRSPLDKLYKSDLFGVILTELFGREEYGIKYSCYGMCSKGIYQYNDERDILVDLNEWHMNCDLEIMGMGWRRIISDSITKKEPELLAKAIEWTDAAQKVLVPTVEKVIEDWEKKYLAEHTEDKHNNSKVKEFKREMKSFYGYIKAMMTFVKILADPTIGGPEMFY